MKLISKKKAAKTGTYLDESEQQRWNAINNQYNDIRIHLADLEMQKAGVAFQVAQTEKARNAIMNELVKKYGDGNAIKVFNDGKVEIQPAQQPQEDLNGKD